MLLFIYLFVKIFCYVNKGAHVMGAVKIVTSEAEFHHLLSESAMKLVVSNFSAPWCDTCQKIKPAFFKLPDIFPSVDFLYVDIEHLESLALQEMVVVLPTFKLYRRTKLIDTLLGNNLEELVIKIKSLYNLENLNSLCDKDKCKGFNCQPVKVYPFLSGTGPNLSSIKGPRMLIRIKFLRTVKMEYFTVRAPINSGPRSISMYANETTMIFDGTEIKSTVKTTEEFLIEPNQLDGFLIRCNAESFKSINYLQIFITANQEKCEKTIVNELNLFGAALSGMSTVASSSSGKKERDKHIKIKSSD